MLVPHAQPLWVIMGVAILYLKNALIHLYISFLVPSHLTPASSHTNIMVMNTKKWKIGLFG
jgi:hypothetical protein